MKAGVLRPMAAENWGEMKMMVELQLEVVGLLMQMAAENWEELERKSVELKWAVLLALQGERMLDRNL